ncbi:MAG TPA: right-handed parallel beta-helix repeat-containing protein [Actinomycetota bacterium]|nr:right-handed parallel beta-helix repeat-containing protein [Actinomycetota bacterium]
MFVKRNQSVGDMTFAAFYASSHVHVAENQVAAREGDPDFPGPAAGIFVGARNHHIVVKRNRVISASGNGIDVRSSGDPALPEAAPEHVQVLGNKVAGVEQHGIEVDADGAGEYLVRGNLALRNTLVGIHLGPETHENRVAGNTALGNAVLDCQDESRGDGTAGTDNTWRDNVGPKASPASAACTTTGPSTARSTTTRRSGTTRGRAASAASPGGCEASPSPLAFGQPRPTSSRREMSDAAASRSRRIVRCPANPGPYGAARGDHPTRSAGESRPAGGRYDAVGAVQARGPPCREGYGIVGDDWC